MRVVATVKGLDISSTIEVSETSVDMLLDETIPSFRTRDEVVKSISRQQLMGDIKDAARRQGLTVRGNEDTEFDFYYLDDERGDKQ